MLTGLNFAAMMIGLAGAALSARQATGADIYRSVAKDGSSRFATQALDATFVLFMRDDKGETSTPAGTRTVRLSRSTLSSTPTVIEPRSRPQADQPVRELIDSTSRKYGMDPALVHAVVAVESRFRTTAVSPKGAAGLMQLMPATAAMYGVTDRADAAQNLDAGVRHLKYLLDRHGGNLALSLAAYNAGEGAVARYAGRIPPYRETMLYVPAVLAHMHARQAVQP